MSDIDQKLRYLVTHEWIRWVDDTTCEIGVSDYAQHALGDVVFVDFPEEGSEVTAEDTCCVVESVKVASDIYAPVSGKVVQINAALNDEPGLINSSPYIDGWIMRIKVDAPQPEAGIDAKAYAGILADEGE